MQIAMTAADFATLAPRLDQRTYASEFSLEPIEKG